MTNYDGATEHFLTEDQLRVLVHPRTSEVFAAFRTLGPMSVEALQQEMSFPSKTLYYQVEKLLAVELLEVAGVEKGTRRERVVYRAVSTPLRIPDGFQGAEYEKLAAQGVASRLRNTIRDFRDAAELSVEQPELVDHLMTLTSVLYLTEDELRQLREKLSQIVDEFRKPQSEGRQALSFTCILTPHRSRLKKIADH